VIAQTQTPRHFFPYLQQFHDPALLAEFIGRHTAQDPAQILQPGGACVTFLHDAEGRFLPFAVTEEELAAARADPSQIIIGPSDANGACRAAARKAAAVALAPSPRSPRRRWEQAARSHASAPRHR
jgi:hypothetical protein